MAAYRLVQTRTLHRLSVPTQLFLPLSRLPSVGEKENEKRDKGGKEVKEGEEGKSDFAPPPPPLFYPSPSFATTPTSQHTLLLPRLFFPAPRPPPLPPPESINSFGKDSTKEKGELKRWRGRENDDGKSPRKQEGQRAGAKEEEEEKRLRVREKETEGRGG